MNMIVMASFVIWAIFDGELGKCGADLAENDISIMNKVRPTSYIELYD